MRSNQLSYGPDVARLKSARLARLPAAVDMSNGESTLRVAECADNGSMAWRSGFRWFGKARASTPIAEGMLDVDGLNIHVVRKPIKNMYLRVKAKGVIEVTAPALMSERKITAFVRSRRNWIDRQLRVAQLSPASSVLDDPQQRKAAEQAIRTQLPQLLDKWEPVIGRKPTNISLRVMSTRWGSCTPKTGRIRLNTQLGLMNPKYLEYVLVHEMTHLWESGHGAAFYRRMDAYLPNWRRLRRELNRHSTQ